MPRRRFASGPIVTCSWVRSEARSSPPRAKQREQDRLLEGGVVDELVEGGGELLEMGPLLLVPRIDWMLAVGPDDAVLDATNQRQDAEVLFVKNLFQLGEKRHRTLLRFSSTGLLRHMPSMSRRLTPSAQTRLGHALNARFSRPVFGRLQAPVSAPAVIEVHTFG